MVRLSRWTTTPERHAMDRAWTQKNFLWRITETVDNKM